MRTVIELLICSMLILLGILFFSIPNMVLPMHLVFGEKSAENPRRILKNRINIGFSDICSSPSEVTMLDCRSIAGLMSK